MKYGIENDNPQISNVLGKVVAQLSEIFDTNHHLIDHHAAYIAQENNGDSIENVPQT